MRTQQRGPITDYFGEGPKVRVWTEDGHRHERQARCKCVHGKEWPEGDAFEGNGGKACRECVLEAFNDPRHPRFLA
jgi:hypothetical protein